MYCISQRQSNSNSSGCVNTIIASNESCASRLPYIEYRDHHLTTVIPLAMNLKNHGSIFYFIFFHSPPQNRNANAGERVIVLSSREHFLGAFQSNPRSFQFHNRNRFISLGRRWKSFDANVWLTMDIMCVRSAIRTAEQKSEREKSECTAEEKKLVVCSHFNRIALLGICCVRKSIRFSFYWQFLCQLLFSLVFFALCFAFVADWKN